MYYYDIDGHKYQSEEWGNVYYIMPNNKNKICLRL